MSKQTAVEYLVEQFAKYYAIHQLDEEIEQAKEMEKEQIIDARVTASFLPTPDNEVYKIEAEQYYNQIFKQ